MDPYIGQIIMFSGNYAPKGWALCNGQLLQIADNPALFAIMGTRYGGNGTSTFGLPDLQARFPMHKDSTFPLAAKGGETAVTLDADHFPAHTHAFMAVPENGDTENPPGQLLSKTLESGGGVSKTFHSQNASQVELHPESLSATGGGQPHDNQSPYLVVNFIIALDGEFPSRS